MREGNPTAKQVDPTKSRRSAVLTVSQQGMAAGGKLYADLMRPSGMEPDRHQTTGDSGNLLAFQTTIGETRFLDASARSVGDVGLVAASIVKEKVGIVAL